MVQYVALLDFLRLNVQLAVSSCHLTDDLSLILTIIRQTSSLKELTIKLIDRNSNIEQLRMDCF